MSNLYVPDLHSSASLEEELSKLSELFSGTVIYVKAAERDVLELNTLLENIVKKGLKMDFTEIYFVTYHDRLGGLRLNNLLPHLAVKQIISFGILPDEMGINVSIKPFEVLDFLNKKLLVVPSLTEIEKSQDHKARLWQGLKAMYNL